MGDGGMKTVTTYHPRDADLAGIAARVDVEQAPQAASG